MQAHNHRVNHKPIILMDYFKNCNFLDFKLSPCSECCMLSSGKFPGV